MMMGTRPVAAILFATRLVWLVIHLRLTCLPMDYHHYQAFGPHQRMSLKVQKIPRLQLLVEAQ